MGLGAGRRDQAKEMSASQEQPAPECPDRHNLCPTPTSQPVHLPRTNLATRNPARAFRSTTKPALTSAQQPLHDTDSCHPGGDGGWVIPAPERTIRGKPVAAAGCAPTFEKVSNSSAWGRYEGPITRSGEDNPCSVGWRPCTVNTGSAKIMRETCDLGPRRRSRVVRFSQCQATANPYQAPGGRFLPREDLRAE